MSEKFENHQTIVKFPRKGNLPAFSVLLHRGGSGGRVIEEVPSKKWIESMQILRADGYMAYTRIVIDPMPYKGYGDYVECRLIFLPGNHQGEHQYTQSGSTEKVWKGNDFSKNVPCFNQGAFVINTSLSDLQDLHKAMGKAIRSIKNKKKTEENQ